MVEKTRSFTITSFWMDWFLLPLMFGAAWLTYRWSLADLKLASLLEGTIPPCILALPLYISAIGFVIAGLGSLIKEEYWEFKAWRTALTLWGIASLVGAGAIIAIDLKGGGFLLADVLNIVGLILMSLILILPAFIRISSPTLNEDFSRGWSILLAASVACLLWGVYLGFPYSFPRFSLALGAIIFVAMGVVELSWAKPAFCWLPRLWQGYGEQTEFVNSLPQAPIWRFEGMIKLIVGIGAVLILFMFW